MSFFLLYLQLGTSSTVRSLDSTLLMNCPGTSCSIQRKKTIWNPIDLIGNLSKSMVVIKSCMTLACMVRYVCISQHTQTHSLSLSLSLSLSPLASSQTYFFLFPNNIFSEYKLYTKTFYSCFRWMMIRLRINVKRHAHVCFISVPPPWKTWNLEGMERHNWSQESVCRLKVSPVSIHKHYIICHSFIGASSSSSSSSSSRRSSSSRVPSSSSSSSSYRRSSSKQSASSSSSHTSRGAGTNVYKITCSHRCFLIALITLCALVKLLDYHSSSSARASITDLLAGTNTHHVFCHSKKSYKVREP